MGREKARSQNSTASTRQMSLDPAHVDAKLKQGAHSAGCILDKNHSRVMRSEHINTRLEKAGSQILP